MGPWILTPSIVVGYDHSSNVFQQAEEVGPVADYSLVVEPKVTATLPFRNSSLDVVYQASWRDYGRVFAETKLAQEAGAHLNLLFADGNRFVLSADRKFGVAKTETFDPGGEIVYRGNSYYLNDYFVDLSREVASHRGYQLRLGRSALHFAASEDVSFFDFEGWSGQAEYREPLRPRTWLVAAYEGSRFDHFCLNVDPDGNPCPGSSKPFRQEDGDTVFLGIRGTGASGEAFLLRVGAARYQYRPESARDFRGFAAEGSLGIAIGGGTSVRVRLARRPYPSFFAGNNFYVMSRIDTELEHRFRSESALGVRVSYWRSSYPNVIAAPGDPDDGKTRLDQHVRGELYANVLFVRRFGIALSAAYQNRASNITFQDYREVSYFAGVTYGFR